MSLIRKHPTNGAEMNIGKLVGAIGIGAALTISSAGAAHASAPSTAGAQSSEGHRVYSTMHSIGFDASVAAAHGYEIRTRADGTQYSVRRGALASASAFGVVGGDCGTSWVWEDGIGNVSVLLDTGFNVYTAVDGRQWRVVLDDNGGESTQNFSGGASGAYWDATRTVGGLTRGAASAHIRSNGSNFAILVDGNVCYSGGPSDSTTIF